MADDAFSDQANGVEPVVEPSRFRQVLGQYPTGVCVVTAQTASGPVGLAVGTVTSVSLDPPLVGFLPAKSSSSWPKIRDAGSFCINVLCDDQERVSRAFSSKQADKFEGLEHTPSMLGNPLLAGAAAWIDCKLSDVFEAGDHFIVVGRVHDLGVVQQQMPLLFFQGGYGRFAAGALSSGDGSLSRELSIVDAARTDLEMLANEFNARCVVSSVVEDRVVVMASAGRAPGRSATLVGERLPLVPPMGTTAMAFASLEQRERWLAVLPESERSSWIDMLDEVRARGYSMTAINDGYEEFEELVARGSTRSSEPFPGDLAEAIRSLRVNPKGLVNHATIRSVHAPVLDGDGQAIVLVNLFFSARTSRSPDLVERSTARLLEVTQKITSASGGRPLSAPVAD